MSRRSLDQIDNAYLKMVCAQQHEAGGVGGIGAALVRLAKLAEAAHIYQRTMGAQGENGAIDLRVQGWTPRHVDAAQSRGSSQKESSR